MNETFDPAGPPDAVDAVVLGNVRSLWEAVDPMPDDLVPMIEFALDAAGTGVEFLHTSARHELVSARGNEHTRLITFDGATVTVMVNVTPNTDGTMRLDGWLIPAASHPVDLRTEAGVLRTSSDNGGRFAFDGVSRGLVQLHVQVGRGVTTPSILL